MATTLVQQMPVTPEASLAAPEAFHLHSWRPWMSLYGLRLRPRGAAHLEVDFWATQAYYPGVVFAGLYAVTLSENN